MLVLWQKYDNDIVDFGNLQTLVTFCLSVLSASLGIVKFLKVGPCRLLSYNKIDLGFFLLTLNIATCIIWKGFILQWMELGDDIFGVMLWISVSILPQMAFVGSIFSYIN